MNPEINFARDPFLSDFESEQVRNFCSWLLNFKPYELPVLTYAIAVVLAETFTIQERTVVGSVFSTIATNTFLIAAQEGFLIQVATLKEQMNTKNNQEDDKSLANRIENIERILKQYGLL